jgi:hypothetical protein
MAPDTTPLRRSAVPWLYGLAALLIVLVPVVLLGVWVGGAGLGAALLATVADLVAALVAAATATVLLARRGVRRVRTAVLGHPDGRAGRLAAHGSARWILARDRFAALRADYARAETDPHEIAARPALLDVSVPATARFVEAFGEAHDLATADEPTDPVHRDRFTAAVGRAVAAWDEARRTADTLAAATWHRVGTDEPPAAAPTLAPGAPRRDRWTGDEYGAAAQAVRAAAARGVRDLRERLQA